MANPKADLVDASNSWHDTFCPYDFVRHPTSKDEVDSWITYSRVRGAIDGKLSHVKKSKPYLQLHFVSSWRWLWACIVRLCRFVFRFVMFYTRFSRLFAGYIIGLHGNLSAASSLRDILQGYYSTRGVARTSNEHDPTSEFNRLSVCRRYDLFPSDMLTGNLEREFISFYRSFAYAYPALVAGLSESRVMEAASRILKRITRATEHKLLSMPSFCDDGTALSIANR